MPRSSTGKWVQRAGSTGGGRTYRGQMPINWYAGLVLIVLLGLGSVVFARYEYQSPAAASTTPPLKGGSPWYAALVVDVCGTAQKVLPSDALDASTQSFYTTGNGVITISPKSNKVAGANAVFGKFVSSYRGLSVSASSMTLPASTAAASTTTTTTTSPSKKSKKPTAKTYRNGQTCAKGTKDAGKKADVEIRYWPSAFSSKEKPATYKGDPATLRFTNDQLITVGFVPVGTTLPKPNGTVVTALLQATTGASSSTTTTTAPSSSTTTTAPSSSTTTTAPASSTTTSS